MLLMFRPREDVPPVTTAPIYPWRIRQRLVKQGLEAR